MRQGPTCWEPSSPCTITEITRPRASSTTGFELNSSRSSTYVWIVSVCICNTELNASITAAKDTNILGFKGPRKMQTILPGMSLDHQRVEIKPRNVSTATQQSTCYSLLTGTNRTKEHGSIIEKWKRKDMTDLVELRNKAPVWNEETQSYVLNFHGRVTQASVKNFQIIHENDRKCVRNLIEIDTRLIVAHAPQSRLHCHAVRAHRRGPFHVRL